MDVKAYDVVMVDLTGSIGNEQNGIRPVVIIQNNKGNAFSNSTIVIPLTSKLKNPNQPTHTIIKKDDSNGLKCDSVALGEQIRCISSKRILKRLGHIHNEYDRNAIKRIYLANIEE